MKIEFDSEIIEVNEGEMIVIRKGVDINQPLKMNVMLC